MKRATVVLADRSIESRKKLQDLLELGEDFTVVGETGDGLKALELIRTLRPQMVVMGSVLPQLDGISVLRAIQKENLEKPLIIMTANSKTAYCEDEAHRLGADAFLERPTNATFISAIAHRLQLERDAGKRENHDNAPVFEQLPAGEVSQELTPIVVSRDDQQPPAK